MDDNINTDSPSPEERVLDITPTTSTTSTTNNNTAVVTILADMSTSNEDYSLDLPAPKRPHLSSSSVPSLYGNGKPDSNHNNKHATMAAGLISAATASAVASGMVSNAQNLNNHEVHAVKQLISGEPISRYVYMHAP